MNQMGNNGTLYSIYNGTKIIPMRVFCGTTQYTMRKKWKIPFKTGHNLCKYYNDLTDAYSL